MSDSIFKDEGARRKALEEAVAFIRDDDWQCPACGGTGIDWNSTGRSPSSHICIDCEGTSVDPRVRTLLEYIDVLQRDVDKLNERISHMLNYGEIWP